MANKDIELYRIIIGSMLAIIGFINIFAINFLKEISKKYDNISERTIKTENRVSKIEGKLEKK